jgi:GNAT superfamily N-acetyltransferase
VDSAAAACSALQPRWEMSIRSRLSFADTFAQAENNVKANIGATASLQAILSAAGLEEEAVAKDGNCLFHALALQLRRAGRFQGDGRALRTYLVEWIRKHGDTFIDDGKGGDLASLRSFVEGDWFGYLTSMGKNGTWGDHTVLVASAMCFRLRVNVYSVAHPTEPLTIVAPPQSAAATAGAQHFPSVATVSLGHYPEVHYVSTRKWDIHSPAPPQRGIRPDSRWGGGLGAPIAASAGCGGGGLIPSHRALEALIASAKLEGSGGWRSARPDASSGGGGGGLGASHRALVGERGLAGVFAAEAIASATANVPGPPCTPTSRTTSSLGVTSSTSDVASAGGGCGCGRGLTRPNEPLAIVSSARAATAIAGAQHYPPVAMIDQGFHHQEQKSTAPCTHSPDSQRGTGTKRRYELPSLPSSQISEDKAANKRFRESGEFVKNNLRSEWRCGGEGEILPTSRSLQCTASEEQGSRNNFERGPNGISWPWHPDYWQSRLGRTVSRGRRIKTAGLRAWAEQHPGAVALGLLDVPGGNKQGSRTPKKVIRSFD